MIRTMKTPRPTPLLLAAFLGLAGLAPDAQAYLDPSTGSMILSAVVGLFATVGLAVKTYWYKLRNLVLRRNPPAAPPAGPSPESRPESAGPAGQGSR
jgi:hypothetical protein